MRPQDYDEVMIVNPGPPGVETTYSEVDDMGYYGEPGGLGYEYEDLGAEDDLGYDADGAWYGDEEAEGGWDPASAYGYAEGPVFGYPEGAVHGFAIPSYVDGYGLAYADPHGVDPWGGYGVAQPEGYGFAYAAPSFGYGVPLMAPHGLAYPYAPFGYADEDPGDLYGYDGYGAYVDDLDPDLDGFDDGYAYGGDLYGLDEDDLYGYDDVEGYVRDTAPPFNPVVTTATNLGGGLGAYDAYVRPRSVSPVCTGVTHPATPITALPETLTPLW